MTGRRSATGQRGFISLGYRGREDPRLQAGDESYPCHNYFRCALIDLI